MSFFEYKILDDSIDGSPDSEFELNELGSEGWELCAVLDFGDTRRWYFKRSRQIQCEKLLPALQK